MWLFWSIQLCILIVPIWTNEQQGRGCDPEIQKLWYSVPDRPNSFIYCHPTKRLFVMEDCLFEKGTQKEFVPTVQQCIWLPSNLTTTLPSIKMTRKLKNTTASVRRHPMFSRYGTVPRLKTIDQELIDQELGSNGQEGSVPTSLDKTPRKCPTGRVPLRKKNSNDPVECVAKADQAIPGVEECGESREFTCSFPSALDKKGVCCQRPPNSRIKCPSQMRPLIDADGLTRPCSPARIGLCRKAGSICVFDENLGDFHCCEPEPAPRQWGKEKPKTSTTMNMLLIRQPSSGLRLSRKQPTKLYNEEADGCPKGETAFKDRNGPLICQSAGTNSGSKCPTGFHCYKSHSNKRSQCCGFNEGYCPEGSAALTATKSASKLKAVSCGPLSGCPDNYFCNKQKHVCCTIESINGQCTHGQALSHVDGRAKRCSNSNCPAGYACSGEFNQTYCCPTPELICSQPLDEGLFCLSAKSKRFFYYHQATGECRQFIYSGCTDNSKAQNRFETQIQCEIFCRRSNVCPVGEPLQKANGQVVNCKNHTDCPNNYNCLATFQGNYCCQSLGNG